MFAVMALHDLEEEDVYKLGVVALRLLLLLSFTHRFYYYYYFNLTRAQRHQQQQPQHLTTIHLISNQKLHTQNNPIVFKPPDTMTSQTPVWFITAASSGFGKYMALEALSRGHKVIASARSTSRIADLKEAGADTLALDVTWPLPQIQQVAKEASEKYGYINHLVNAAGYILVGAVEETR